MKECIALDGQIKELVRKRDLVASGVALDICVQATRLDDAFINECRPAVVEAFNKRIGALNKELISLGATTNESS
ncbi:hypothetical protein Ea92_32 [Erwinia phage Ea9-2]|uniref:Uncharacterized protein n=1 Tax=Erwinia phage Ea9-2 TaxID=1429767 RepID=W6B105_9CAUD|nr:hypothetical protein Ea92_32 [Erwinia phage Ea9-2]AHI60089.1 hypothetical protein Ea92_32 [Erwinia phage Ea9-2]